MKERNVFYDYPVEDLERERELGERPRQQRGRTLGRARITESMIVVGDGSTLWYLF